MNKMYKLNRIIILSIFFCSIDVLFIPIEAFKQNIRLLVKNVEIHSVTHETSVSRLYATLEVPLKQQLADNVIGTMFKVKPIFKMISQSARNSMIKRADMINVDWIGNRKKLEMQRIRLETIYDSLVSPSLVYPDYYLKPFHAYDEGNLSWEAAYEVESAAKTVHAPIYTSDSKILETNGDEKLRNEFHLKMKESFSANQFNPRKIIDLGCSTGLSTMKLHESFPEAEIFGVDLSPYMLSVAKLQLDSNILAQSKIQYAHLGGEYLSSSFANVDLVSMCLVAHELPRDITKKIFTEAYKVLKPNGMISFMDMDPQSLFFQKFLTNPFAFAAFKSTEPWIQEYVALDLIDVLKTIGFSRIEVKHNSPRHRTIVAIK